MFNSKFIIAATMLVGISSAEAGTGGNATASSRLIPYEGTLMRAGAPETGDYEMRFYLCATEDPCHSLSNLWWETQAVTVSDGRFAVALGESLALTSSVFSGVALYLGIDVRPSGSDTWTALGGKQRILPAPFAVRSAPESDFVAGENNELVVDRTNRRVGVGTATPSAALSVSGAAGGETHLEGSFIDSSQQLTIGGGRVGGQVAQDVVVGAQTQIHVSASSGNVGVGGVATSAKLNVAGTLRAGSDLVVTGRIVPESGHAHVEGSLTSTGTIEAPSVRVIEGNRVDNGQTNVRDLSTFVAESCATVGEIQVRPYSGVYQFISSAFCFCATQVGGTSRWTCMAP